jgi:hypothetical protein
MKQLKIEKDYKMTKVTNMLSNTGNPVPNQFVIMQGDVSTFQSYDSTIAIIDGKSHPRKITIDPDYYDYSVTTMKYLSRFLGHGIAETRSNWRSGIYKTRSLNSY